MLKYTCKYWNILAPLVKKSLKKHYGKAFADKTMIKAKSEYRAMLERVDDIESGTFYSTDNGEGYILITDTKGNHPNFRSIVKMARRMKNALGGWGKLFSFLKQANSGCDKKPLEIQMKKQKKPYVKVEMLIVTEKYQGQGYMRKLMEFAYKMADKKRLSLHTGYRRKG